MAVQWRPSHSLLGADVQLLLLIGVAADGAAAVAADGAAAVAADGAAAVADVVAAQAGCSKATTDHSKFAADGHDHCRAAGNRPNRKKPLQLKKYNSDRQ